MKTVKVKSGIQGWQERLQKIYGTFESFESSCDVFDIAHRLGFKSTELAWKTNPTIQGSVIPSDLCVVIEKLKEKKLSKKAKAIDDYCKSLVAEGGSDS